MKKHITSGDTLLVNVAPLTEQGDTYDVTVGTWGVRIGIFDETTQEQIALSDQYTLGEDGMSFDCYFTPEQTDAILPGSYILAAQVDCIDSTPPLSIEMHDILTVKANLIH